MGCRPSKQATSKVRAVEHAEDPKCLCSPRKARKQHKCDGSNNSSKRVSAGSKSESKKHSFTSAQRPRAAKSSELDFPAFSTTTAVYRKSASKTSKITLRLSCDGSTLEIEQCDYDLERVQGEATTTPRPWNSAPNLIRLRDNKSRLFRDTQLPMKHSASAWSPSVTSTASGSRGCKLRVPVEMNTPVDKLISPGYISGANSSNASNTGSTSSQDRGTRATTCCTPSQRPRTRASGGFTMSDEREPLLPSSDDGCQKQACAASNLNGTRNRSRQRSHNERMPGSKTLDNIISDLENSLECNGNHSCPLDTRRPHSLDVNTICANNQSCDQSSQSNARRSLLQSSLDGSYNSGISPDFERIPVNVVLFSPPYSTGISDNICSHQEYKEANVCVCTQASADIHYNASHIKKTHLAANNGTCSSIAIFKCQDDPISYRFGDCHPHINSESQNWKSGHCGSISPDVKTKSSSYEIVNNIAHMDHISLRPSSPVDSDSVLTFVTLGCPVSNEMSNFMSAPEREFPLSLLTSQHGRLSPQGAPNTDVPEKCFSRSIAGNGEDMGVATLNVGHNLSMGYDVTQARNLESVVDNATELPAGNLRLGGLSPIGAPLTAKVFMRNIRGQATQILQDPPFNDKAISRSQMGAGCVWGKAGTGWGPDVSLVGGRAGMVEENYISLPGDEGRTTVRREFHLSPRPVGTDTFCGRRQARPCGGKLPESRNLRQTCENEREHLALCEGKHGETPCFPNPRPTTDENEREAKSCNYQTHCSHLPMAMYHPHCLPPRFSDVGSSCLVCENEEYAQGQQPNLTEGGYAETVCYTPRVQSLLGEGATEDICTEDMDAADKNADYLMELLQPGRHETVTQRETKFSFDLAQADDAEPSTPTDASDNEMSPQCYVLIGQQPTPTNSQLCVSKTSIGDDNSKSVFTSMQAVRTEILNRNLRNLRHCINELDNQASTLYRKDTKDSAKVSGAENGRYNNQTDSVICIAGPTIHYTGPYEKTEVNGDGLLADNLVQSSVRKLGNSIKQIPDMTTTGTLKDNIDNGRKNKRAIITLRVDILTRNIIAAGDRGFTAFWSHGNSGTWRTNRSITENDLCKNQPRMVSPQSFSVVSPQSFSVVSPQSFSATSKYSNDGAVQICDKAAGVLSSPSSTRRPFQVHSKGDNVLIDAALACGHERSMEVFSDRQRKGLIDSPQKTHLSIDETRESAFPFKYQANQIHDMTLTNPITDPSSKNELVDTSASEMLSFLDRYTINHSSFGAPSRRNSSDYPHCDDTCTKWSNCDDASTKWSNCDVARPERATCSLGAESWRNRTNSLPIGSEHQTIQLKTRNPEPYNPMPNSIVDPDNRQLLVDGPVMENRLDPRSDLQPSPTEERLVNNILEYHSNEMENVDGITSDLSTKNDKTLISESRCPYRECRQTFNHYQRSISWTDSECPGLDIIIPPSQNDPGTVGLPRSPGSLESRAVPTVQGGIDHNGGNSSLFAHQSEKTIFKRSNNMNMISSDEGLQSCCQPLPNPNIDHLSAPSLTTGQASPNLTCIPHVGKISDWPPSVLHWPDTAGLNSKLLLIDPALADTVRNSITEREGVNLDESREMPRRNVLSLVRYFEKVPYNRNESK